MKLKKTLLVFLFALAAVATAESYGFKKLILQDGGGPPTCWPCTPVK